MNEDEKETYEVPDELYAPMGELTFENPNKKKEVEPEVLSYQNVKLEYSEKPFDKQKFIKRLIIFLVILILGTIGFIYITNKKLILKKAFVQVGNKIEDSIYAIKNNPLTNFSNEEPFIMSALVSFDTTYNSEDITKEEKNLLDILDDTSISETLQIDYPNKQFTHNLKSKYKDQNILSIRGNATENTINFRILEVVSKYIEYPLNELDFFYKNPDETKKTLNSINKKLLNETSKLIKENSLKKTKTTINVGDNKHNVKDISFTLTKQQIQDIFKKTFSELKEKENILNYLETEFLKLNINDLKVNVYSEGIQNNIIGIKLSTTNYEIKYLEDDNISLMQIIHKNKNLFSIKQIKQNDEIKKIYISYRDLNIAIEKNITSRTVYNFTITNNDEKYVGNLIFKDQQTKNSKDGDIQLLISRMSNQEKKYDLQIILNYNIELVDKIELYDDTQKINYKTISVKDKKEIENKINNSDTFKFIKQKINAYIKNKK